MMQASLMFLPYFALYRLQRRKLYSKQIRRTVCVLEIIWTELIMEQTNKKLPNRFESNSIKAMQIICHTNVI